MRHLPRRAFIILFHLAAGLSLALCVATAVAWMRGGWTQTQFHSLGGGFEYVTDGGSYDGLVQIVIVHHWPAPIVGPSARTGGTPVDAWINHPFHFRIESGRFVLHYWVELGPVTGGNWTIEGRRLDVDAPFGGAIILLLIPPTFAWVFLPIRRHGIRSIRPKPELRVDNSLVITDLACVRCGYNLKTQTSDGRCPECGLPASASLAQDADLAKSCPAWLRRLAVGHVLLLLARVFLAATLAAVFQSGFVTEFVIGVWCAGAGLMLYGLGIFLVTAGEHPHRQRRSRGAAIRLRQLTAMSLICLMAGICCQLIGTMTAPRPMGQMGLVTLQWYWPPLLLLLAGGVLFCCCVMVEFLFLGNLGDRLGDRLLAKLCVAAGAGATACNVAMLYGAERIGTQWNRLGVFGAVIIVWLLSLLCTGLINLDFAVRLSAKASVSRKQQPLQSVGTH